MGMLMPGAEAPVPGGLRSVGLAKKFFHVFHHIYRKTQMSFLANPVAQLLTEVDISLLVRPLSLLLRGQDQALGAPFD